MNPKNYPTNVVELFPTQGSSALQVDYASSNRPALQLVPQLPAARPLPDGARTDRHLPPTVGILAKVLRAALAALVAIGIGGFIGASLAPDPVDLGQMEMHVVQPGESLWDFANVPGLDAQSAVAELVSVNGLPSADLQIGQRILVPRS